MLFKKIEYKVIHGYSWIGAYCFKNIPQGYVKGYGYILNGIGPTVGIKRDDGDPVIFVPY